MRNIKLATGTILAAFALAACGTTSTTPEDVPETTATTEDTTRDRLESQGIVYSTTDWETTVKRICDTDKPGVYMGIDSEIRKHEDDLTTREKHNMILSSIQGGEAPNADILTDREKRMVIDVILDGGCDTQAGVPTSAGATTPKLDPTLQAYIKIQEAGVNGVNLGNIDVYVETICDAVEDGVSIANREEGLQMHNPEWTDGEVQTINDVIMDVAC